MKQIYCLLVLLYTATSRPIDPVYNTHIDYLKQFGYLEETTSLQNVYEAAITRFQNMFGLPSTGYVDQDTLILMNTPRCGFRDVYSDQNNKNAQSVAARSTYWQHKNSITYRINTYSRDIPRYQQDWAIMYALNAWRRVTNLVFVKVTTISDIEISFSVGHHGDDVPFDGKNGVYAHAYFPGSGLGGDIHVDDAEDWNMSWLSLIFAHEVGHSLGLTHSTVYGSVMVPFPGKRRHWTLSEDDINRIQDIYGPPTPAPRITTKITTANVATTATTTTSVKTTDTSPKQTTFKTTNMDRKSSQHTMATTSNQSIISTLILRTSSTSAEITSATSRSNSATNTTHCQITTETTTENPQIFTTINQENNNMTIATTQSTNIKSTMLMTTAPSTPMKLTTTEKPPITTTAMFTSQPKVNEDFTFVSTIIHNNETSSIPKRKTTLSLPRTRSAKPVTLPSKSWPTVNHRSTTETLSLLTLFYWKKTKAQTDLTVPRTVTQYTTPTVVQPSSTQLISGTLITQKLSTSLSHTTQPCSVCDFNSQIDAITGGHNDLIYIFQATCYVSVNNNGVVQQGYPRPIASLFPHGQYPYAIDAALYLPPILEQTCFTLPNGYRYCYGEKRTVESAKTYLFSGAHYYQFKNGNLAPESYKEMGNISQIFPGIPLQVNAAFSTNGRDIYFVKGDQIWHIQRNAVEVDIGYPVSITSEILGLANVHQDAIYADGTEGVLYFFSEENFYSGSTKTKTIDTMARNIKNKFIKLNTCK